MGKDTNAELLTANNNASYKTVNGVTYFKLVSEFEGDYTKNCGLLGSEMDENFYFLRGYDIEDVTYDKETKTLIITRVDKDYDPMEINIGEEIASDRPEFSFDKETGKLTITYPDGTEMVVDGFLVEGSERVSVASDSSLTGNGTTFRPLGLSPMWKTGTYAPASELLDLEADSSDWGKPITTACEEKGIHISGGLRIVSKEKMTKFGFLYPYSGVEKIEDALRESGSEWRVPSKEDWDELLDSMETEEHQVHGETEQIGFVGENAGAILKSAEYWKESTNPEAAGVDSVGFNILPVGGVEERNSWMRPDDGSSDDYDDDIEGFGEFAGYWSTTSGSDGGIYTKVFTYYEPRVNNYKATKDMLFGVRLVKEYNIEDGLDSDNEDILGFTYPIAKIQGRCKNYAKIWTLKNFYNEPDYFGGKASREWSAATEDELGLETVYFVNEWDGSRWFKKQLQEGDSIVILSKDGGDDYHEYRLIHGELVDTLKNAEDLISGATAELVENLDALSAATEGLGTALEELGENLSALSAATIEEEERASAAEMAIMDTVEEVSANVETLFNEVSELSGSTGDIDEKLDACIDNLETLSASVLSNETFIEAVSPIDANVRDEYVLKNAAGDELGEHIKIYKDSALLAVLHGYSGATGVTENDGQYSLSYNDDIDLSHEFIYFVYADKNGETKLIGLDLEKFVIESEFGNGLYVDPLTHKVSILVDPNDEGYISVGENGIKTDGISSALLEISESKAVDIVYDRDANSPKYIQMLLADGTLTDGFSASDFIKDSVLTSVSLEGQDLVFIWNDDANTKITVPLSSLSDVYVVASGSSSYLKIDGKNVSAIVDKDGGFAKTLSTTDYADNKAESAYTRAVDHIDAELAIINGDESVAGSIRHTVGDKFSKDLITGGLPATDVTLEEAKEHSLLRVINVNGEDRYYATSKATDMLFVSGDTTTNLNSYIASLESRISELEAENVELAGRVEALENAGLDENAVKDIIRNYLVGVSREIKIEESGDNLQIGFSDNAIFGDVSN